jgi:hypothetical protein
MAEIEGRTIGDPPDEGKQFIDAVSNGFSSLLTAISAVSKSLENKPRTIERLWSLGTDRTNVYRTTKAIYLERIVWGGHDVLFGGGVDVTMMVGTIAYPFHFDMSPQDLAFPIRLDRGVDVQFIYPMGVLVHSDVYLIGIAG